MRSLALSFAISALTACAGTPPGEPGAETTDSPELPEPGAAEDPGAHPGPNTALRAVAYFFTPSCDLPIIDYEAEAYRGDMVVFGVTCAWTFDDGATSDDCAGQHEFAEAGYHGYTLVIRELATGEQATTSGQLHVDPPLTIDLEVDVPACGLAFSWTSEISLPSFEYSSVAPTENVVGQFFFFTGSGAVEVTQPGAYELTVYAEHERPAGLICTKEVVRTVTVQACEDDHDHDDDHDHTPTCGH